jgi:excisionase family DNA binding protein
MAQSSDNARPPYDVPEVASVLNVSEEVVRGAARSGRLPAFKVGRAWRFPRSRIDALAEAGGEQAA